MKTVFVTDKSWPKYDEFIAKVEAAGGKVVFASAQDEATLIREAADADVIVNSFAKVTENVIAALKHCEMIVRTGISVDTIDVEAATAKGIKVCYVPDYCRDEVADHTFTLALVSLRKISLLNKRMHQGVWNSVEAGYVPRLNTITFGLVGFGAIAKKMAVRAKSFGMKVIAYDPFLDDSVFEENGVEHAVEMVDVFKAADVISLHLPLNKKTHHVINAEAFASMKDNVVFVNTARGGLVDTDALIDALKCGKVGAAGIDVFEVEPLNTDSELLNMDNVLVTPHAAYYSSASLPELVDKSTDEVIRVLEGRESRIVVNKKELGL